MAATENDQMRREFTSARVQVPTWLAVTSLLATGISAVWFDVTKAPALPFVTFGAFLLFLVSAMIVSRRGERIILAYYLKGQR